jgi:hypothetical protein
MIRIQTSSDSQGVRIVIDGQLAGDDVLQIETSLHSAFDPHKLASLFLRDVSHIDDVGRKLLSRLARNGVKLTASGVYSSYVVDEIRRGAKPDIVPGK